MRSPTIQFLNAPIQTISVRNNNSSAAILDGTPVFFDGPAVATYPLVDVKRASEAGAPQTGLLVGLVRTDKSAGIAVGEVGECLVYGFTSVRVKFLKRTRAASTDDWSSMPAVAIGDPFIPETVHNALKRKTAGAIDDPLYPIIALETKASLASVGSATSDTATVQTDTIKVFVRTLGQ